MSNVTNVSGTVNVGNITLTNYTIEISEIDGGICLTVTDNRGNVQTANILHGAKSILTVGADGYLYQDWEDEA